MKISHNQFISYTALSVSEVFEKLHTSERGLDDEVVGTSRKANGKNIIDAHANSAYDIFFRQFKSPFLYLLGFAALLSFLLNQVTDGIIILIFVSVNAALGFYQEFKSEKTLKLLNQYVVAKSRVLRNGVEILIPSNELVVGDVMLLQAGDSITADIRIIGSEKMTVDESILTGETVPISKTSQEFKEEKKELYLATNIGFAGTTVISGSGRGVVIAVGRNMVIGGIAQLATETQHQSTFEKGIARLSSFILKLIVVTLIFIVLLNILIKGQADHFATLIIFAIALAISVIPEALPVVTTFSFSRGALRLAKHKVVVKRLAAIEDLGSVEILCTDKTGTITENKLEVSEVYKKNEKAILFGALASSLGFEHRAVRDSFDSALYTALKSHEEFKTYHRMQEIPFDPIRRRTSVLVEKDGDRILIVRGAFESVAPLCNLSEKNQKELSEWAEKQGTDAKRVIAVAEKKLTSQMSSHFEDHEKDLELVGLISFVDPLKKTAFASIKKAEDIGVSIKILTGDSREVAGAVAAQIGLIKEPSLVITGSEFESLDMQKKHEAATNFSVFARVTPEQKHKIIQLLQEKHEVGFLGEGINDAPALKTANVAIVVAGASDIARDAADIILLNKSLHVIVEGIEEGREIFGNTVKYIKATLASNFGNFYTVALASLFISFLPLLPVQILLINMLTDFPMIAVSTDNVDSQELKRPRNYDVREIALFATIMGVVSSFFDFLFFFFFYNVLPHQVLQTNWFIGSVLTELVFLFAIRSRLPIWRASLPSRTLVLLSILAFATAIILPFTHFGQSAFGFVQPTTSSLLIVLSLTLGFFVTTEFVKNMYYKFLGTKQ